jgi:hypothetical protein
MDFMKVLLLAEAVVPKDFSDFDENELLKTECTFLNHFEIA